MQLDEFEIKALFGKYNHTISFPHRDENDPNPSLVILHGKNGIGKTTILKMIDGILKLDFNIFRSVPFKHSILKFSNGEKIKVEFTKNSKEKTECLLVTYKRKKIYLNYYQSGPLHENDRLKIDTFREEFHSKTNTINYELINTERLTQKPDDDIEEYDAPHEIIVEGDTLIRRSFIHGRIPSRLKKRPLKRKPEKLSLKVRQFIGEAQVNYRNYFATTEPDLFPKILERITEQKEKKYHADEMLKRIELLSQRDRLTERFGLESERWNKNKLAEVLKKSKAKKVDSHAFMIIDSYLEYLESKIAQRELISNRLKTFEETLSSFITDKNITIDSKEGLSIKTGEGQPLRESQLSSGEYHLLFLLVSSLVTKRSGTVIAIDEPEMSMHISWQRKLVDAILKCASMAQPQLILATHSPDIAAEYPDNLINLID